MSAQFQSKYIIQEQNICRFFPNSSPLSTFEFYQSEMKTCFQDFILKEVVIIFKLDYKVPINQIDQC